MSKEIGLRYASDSSLSPKEKERYRIKAYRLLKKLTKAVGSSIKRASVIVTIPEESIPILQNDCKSTIIPLESVDPIYKAACHDLIMLFNAFVENPTKPYFLELVDKLDTKNIDKVMEMLEHE